MRIFFITFLLPKTSLKKTLNFCAEYIDNSKFGDTHLGNKQTEFANIEEGTIVETNDVKQFNVALSKVNDGLNALV